MSYIYDSRINLTEISTYCMQIICQDIRLAYQVANNYMYWNNDMRLVGKLKTQDITESMQHVDVHVELVLEEIIIAACLLVL